VRSAAQSKSSTVQVRRSSRNKWWVWMFLAVGCSMTIIQFLQTHIISAIASSFLLVHLVKILSGHLSWICWATMCNCEVPGKIIQINRSPRSVTFGLVIVVNEQS
jgi:hypothetical protein